MKISRGLAQAYDVQDFAYECMMSVKAALGKNCLPDKDDAAKIAGLGKLWRDAQEQIRIHRGKPLPGSYSHEKVRAPRTRQAKLSSLSAMLANEEASGVQVATCQHGVQVGLPCGQCNNAP